EEDQVDALDQPGGEEGAVEHASALADHRIDSPRCQPLQEHRQVDPPAAGAARAAGAAGKHRFHPALRQEFHVAPRRLLADSHQRPCRAVEKAAVTREPAGPVEGGAHTGVPRRGMGGESGIVDPHRLRADQDGRVAAADRGLVLQDLPGCSQEAFQIMGVAAPLPGDDAVDRDGGEEGYAHRAKYRRASSRSAGVSISNTGAVYSRKSILSPRSMARCRKLARGSSQPPGSQGATRADWTRKSGMLSSNFPPRMAVTAGT